jgi:hypothetical protein
MRTLLAVCLFAAACFAQDGSASSVLDRLETRQGPVAAADIGVLSRALQADLGGGGSIGPQHRLLIGRTSNYLSQLQTRPDLDPTVGLAAASAWQRMAMAMDAPDGAMAADPSGALLGYRNAYLLYSRYGSQSGQLGYLGGRIRALGGSMPGWISIGVNPQQESRSQNEWGGMPLRPAANAPSGPLAQLPPFPKLDAASLPPEAARQYRLIEERYTSVAASVYTARSSTEAIRLSVQGRGLALHPETEQMLVRMDLSMNLALKAIEAQRWDDGRGHLDAAAEYASRLLKIAGR